jgi:hypothetical protein
MFRLFSFTPSETFALVFHEGAITEVRGDPVGRERRELGEIGSICKATGEVRYLTSGKLAFSETIHPRHQPRFRNAMARLRPDGRAPS